MDATIITGLIDKVLDIGKSIVDLFSKGKPDVTEIEKKQLEIEMVVAQIRMWIQQAFVEKDAWWKSTLIIISGLAVLAVPLNNMLVSAYFPAGKPVDIVSPEMGILIGFFILIITGKYDLLEKIGNAIVQWFINRKGK